MREMLQKTSAQRSRVFTLKYNGKSSTVEWRNVFCVYLFFSAKGKRAISLDRLPPKTPDKCDPMLSFDAVTGMQQELVFFKNR